MVGARSSAQNGLTFSKTAFRFFCSLPWSKGERHTKPMLISCGGSAWPSPVLRRWRFLDVTAEPATAIFMASCKVPVL